MDLGETREYFGSRGLGKRKKVTAEVIARAVTDQTRLLVREVIILRRVDTRDVDNCRQFEMRVTLLIDVCRTCTQARRRRDEAACRAE